MQYGSMSSCISGLVQRQANAQGLFSRYKQRTSRRVSALGRRTTTRLGKDGRILLILLMLFCDLLLPTLQVEVLHRAIQVQRKTVHTLEQLKIQRAFIDCIGDCCSDIYGNNLGC